MFWGSNSMVPQPHDVAQIYQHFRYFFGLGPRPRFGRWAYWEKFDYWAVFWGVGVIGASGLMLWFPTLFSQFLPGWVFNIAIIVHSDEALLATGFIFTVHFFNSHLRPEKFPMDPVIFTGRWTRRSSGATTAGVRAPPPHGHAGPDRGGPPPLWMRNFARVVGYVAGDRPHLVV
jgi:hypothetical protein